MRKVYELNVWEGASHCNFLFTNAKEAVRRGYELRSCADVSEVWLRVWEKGEGGILVIAENEPLWQR